MSKIPIAVLLLLFTATASFSNGIDNVQKWAWGQAAGWINHQTAESLNVYSSHLEGYAYSENIGWIRFGKYTGGDAHTYGNSNADDYGVNNDGYGNLSGYAWSSTAGWIQFAPANGGVSIDTATGAFSGYAYSDNLGWISFAGRTADLTPYGVATGWRRDPVFILTYTADAGGFIAGDTLQSIQSGGHGASVRALPDSGYHFEEWSDGRTDNPRIDSTVTGPAVITAFFEENTISVGRFIPGTNGVVDMGLTAYPVPQPVGCSHIDFAFTAAGNVEFSLTVYTLDARKILETGSGRSLGRAERDVAVARFKTGRFSEGSYYAVLSTRDLRTGKAGTAVLQFLINR